MYQDLIKNLLSCFRRKFARGAYKHSLSSLFGFESEKYIILSSVYTWISFLAFTNMPVDKSASCFRLWIRNFIPTGRLRSWVQYHKSFFSFVCRCVLDAEIIFLFMGWGETESTWCRLLLCLSYQPLMMMIWQMSGVVSKVIIGKGNRSTPRKPAYSAILSSTNPAWTDLGSNPATAVGSRKQRAWAMARPSQNLTDAFCFKRIQDRPFRLLSKWDSRCDDFYLRGADSFLRIVAHVVNKFPPPCYGTQQFITGLTKICHRSLSWARMVKSVPSHPTSVKFILI